MPGEWPVKVEVPGADSAEVKKAIDELVELYVTKGGSFKHADGKIESVALSEVDELTSSKLRTSEKLMYLGERTIRRLGCFGCHTIPGFENAKPIGTALNGWGIKNPARLDFGHIREYLEEQPEVKATEDETACATAPPPEYQEKLAHEHADRASSSRSCTGPAATTT